jgi:hypothetical protein
LKGDKIKQVSFRVHSWVKRKESPLRQDTGPNSHQALPATKQPQPGKPKCLRDGRFGDSVGHRLPPTPAIAECCERSPRTSLRAQFPLGVRPPGPAL